MRSTVISVLMLIVGIIHLLPVAGMLGVTRLEALYQIELNSPELGILMRHRAVLFGLLGSFICYAAFRPNFQPAAFLMAGVSVISFLVLYLLADQANDAIFKVVIADVIALGCLTTAVVLYYKPQM